MINISVVIPTYNRRIEVLRAIASVRAQTVAVLEIIVIDDGSTDDTETYLSATELPIRYVRTPNRGVSWARNLGINLSAGNWIAFLDSDDEWHPEKLARQITCIEETEVVVCFTGSGDEQGERLDDLAAMDPDLAIGDSRAYPPMNPDFFLHSRHPFIQSALIKKTALLDAGLFDITLRVAEDTKLIYRLVMLNRYAVVNAPLITLCRHREICGLSDDNEPRAAMIRYQCATRVQSEFYWIMLDRDKMIANRMRRNYGYFVSRWAELAAVLGHFQLARSLGYEGIVSGSTVKNRVRSLMVWISPHSFRALMRRKWRI